MPAAGYEPTPPGAQGLPLPAAQAHHHSRQSGLGTRYDVLPPGPGVRLPDRCRRRGQPQGAGAQGGHHDGGVPRRGSSGTGLRPLRHAGARQHRPGQPVHGRGLHRGRAQARLQALDGRARGLARARSLPSGHNVFVERLWHSVKYECVYLKAYDSISAARADIGRYIDWFNTQRPHSSLQDLTPQQAYWSTLPNLQEVA